MHFCHFSAIFSKKKQNGANSWRQFVENFLAVRMRGFHEIIHCVFEDYIGAKVMKGRREFHSTLSFSEIILLPRGAVSGSRAELPNFLTIRSD